MESQTEEEGGLTSPEVAEGVEAKKEAVCDGMMMTMISVWILDHLVPAGTFDLYLQIYENVIILKIFVSNCNTVSWSLS